MKLDLTLYGITDSRWSERISLPQQVEKALQGGVTLIQYREKHLTGEEKKREALAIMEVCHRYGVLFLVNDDVELAAEIDADGVHLGQGDMELTAARAILEAKGTGKKIIGITAKTVEQAQLAQQNGADYLGSGAVFGTSTKMDAKPMDHALLDEICASVSIPVVAIGGIDKTNLLELKGRKMSGFAIVSGIFGQEDILAASKELKTLALEALER